MGESQEPEGEDAVSKIVYQCEVCKVRDRLDIMGFTLNRVKRDFENLLSSHVESIVGSEIDPEYSAEYAADVQFYQGLTFETYLQGLKQLLKLRIQPWESDDHQVPELLEEAKYILSNYGEGCPMGLFSADIRSLIRAACELVQGCAFVALDVTEIVEAGYFHPDFKFVQNSTHALLSRHPENAQRIILTEGKTDRRFLCAAMSVLYPHLLEYYSFFDFEETRSEGGVGRLVALVKGFVAAGVTNRVIAVFDNDTASKDAIKSLEGISLPSNIVVLTYPDLDLLKDYPTIGPTGRVRINVNGMAASIELFLGQDVLIDKDSGQLTPVQWKGYNEALKQYQGEVLNKRLIHERFAHKLNAASSDPKVIKAQDWSGLEAILNSIFKAFD